MDVLNPRPYLTHAASVHTRPSFVLANSQVSATFHPSQCFGFSVMSALPPPQACTSTLGTPAPDRPTLAMYTGYERFPRPAPRVQPLVTFGNSKPEFHGPLSDAKSDLLHAQYRLSLLQWNAGVARRRPTQPCAVPSTQCCSRRPTTMSRTSLTSSTRTQSTEVWPSSSTRTRSCQTR